MFILYRKETSAVQKDKISCVKFNKVCFVLFVIRFYLIIKLNFKRKTF